MIGEKGATLKRIGTEARQEIEALLSARVMLRPGSGSYLVNGRSNDVAVIDVASRSVVATIAVGERPWGIALSGDGRTLYTANGRSASVLIIDVTSRRVTATIAVGGRPYSVLLVP